MYTRYHHRDVYVRVRILYYQRTRIHLRIWKNITHLSDTSWISYVHGTQLSNIPATVRFICIDVFLHLYLAIYLWLSLRLIRWFFTLSTKRRSRVESSSNIYLKRVLLRWLYTECLDELVNAQHMVNCCTEMWYKIGRRIRMRGIWLMLKRETCLTLLCPGEMRRVKFRNFCCVV